MTSHLPLVSIVIPVYNGVDYMREAIDSALSQTYPHIEVLVVNDGSTDSGATAAVARSYGDKIRYFEKKNGGVSSALNYGIRNMRGSYFSWLSHDDVYETTKVENQVKLLQQYGSDSVVAYCSSDKINKHSQVYPNSFVQKPDRFFRHKDALINIIKNSAGGCSFLIPRGVFDKVGLFDESLRYCQDILMWWKIFMQPYDLVMSSDLGVHYRVHDRQVTQTMPQLYHTEAQQIAQMMAPAFAACSDKKDYNFLYCYAKGEAVHGNKPSVSLCMEEAGKHGLFSFGQKMKLRLLCCYGSFRPFIRKMYYKLFRRVKTA